MANPAGQPLFFPNIGSGSAQVVVGHALTITNGHIINASSSTMYFKFWDATTATGLNYASPDYVVFVQPSAATDFIGQGTMSFRKGVTVFSSVAGANTVTGTTGITAHLSLVVE